MKNVITLLASLFLLSIVALSQTPQAFKYQAVARDASGNILPNQTIGFRISIVQGSTSGTSVYTETHGAGTNDLGLVNLSIGTGSAITGVFNQIAWETDDFFIKVEMDVNGGTNYILMGTAQLLSVPYALHAKTVENDNDQQTLAFNNTSGDLTISNGNTVTIPLNATGGDNWGTQVVISDATISGDGTAANPISVQGNLTDDQLLSLTGNNLSIENANSVDLSSYLDNTDAQNLSFSGTSLSINNGNTVDLSSLQDGVNDADPDPTNELNTGAFLNGTDLVIIDAGGSQTADLSSLQDGTGTDDQHIMGSGLAGTTLIIGIENGASENVDLSTLVDDADADPTNEIELPASANLNDVLQWNGAAWVAGSAAASSGNTLDMAYDQGGAGTGRTINVDAGEVDISTSSANGIALRTTNNNTGVGIVSTTTNSANTFSAIQASTNSTSTIAAAIIGNTDGAAWGISGQAGATSTAGSAVYGSNLRTNGGHGILGIGFNGTVGQTNYSSGYGIYGENFDAVLPLGNGVGVAGKGFYGVLGEDRYLGAAAGAYGVYSNGNFGATGTKSFCIDHPIDPENKYLKHFSIESNEVLNVYRGTVSFDLNGEAVIDLPDYFNSINRNISYQLTPIGAFMPLFIKDKVKDLKFVVGGGTFGKEVSWVIYAERNDLYMQTYPHQRLVEVEKRESVKGTYLIPELYDQPATKSTFQNVEKVDQTKLNIKR